MDVESAQANNQSVGNKQNGDDGNRQKLQYSVPGILHFLQHEFARFESDRAQWEMERAELQARIAFLQGERKGQENLKNDLVRRIKMLEYALKQERVKYNKLKYGTDVNTEDLKPPAFAEEINCDDLLMGDNRDMMTPATNVSWRQGRQLLRQYLQEIGYTDTIIDVRSARVRSLLGLTPSKSSNDLDDHNNSLNVSMGGGGPMNGGDQCGSGPGRKDGQHQDKSRSGKRLGGGILSSAIEQTLLQSEASVFATFDFLQGEHGVSDGDDDDENIGDDDDEADEQMEMKRIKSKAECNAGGIDDIDSETEEVMAEFDFLHQPGGMGGVIGGDMVSGDQIRTQGEGKNLWEGQGDEAEMNDVETVLDRTLEVQQESKDIVDHVRNNKMTIGENNGYVYSLKRPVRVKAKNFMDLQTLLAVNDEPTDSELAEHLSTASADSNQPVENNRDRPAAISNRNMFGLGGMSSGSVTYDLIFGSCPDDTAGGNPQNYPYGPNQRRFSGGNASGIDAMSENTLGLGELATLTVNNEADVSSYDGGKDMGGNMRRTWTAKYSLRSHFDVVRALAFHPVEPVLVTASEDHTLKMWNLQKTIPAKKTTSLDVEPLYTFRAHRGSVLSLAMSPTGEQCYSGGSDGTIRCWSIPSSNIDPYDAYDPGVIACTLLGHTDSVWSLAVHSSRSQILSCAADGTVRLWAPPQQTGSQGFSSSTKQHLLNTYVMDKADGNPSSVDFVRCDPAQMVAAFTSSQAVVYDLETGKPIVRLDADQSTDMPGYAKQINRVVSHPTVPVTIAAHEDRHIRFYDNNTGKLIHSMVAHLDAVTCLAIDPNGLYLLSGSHDCSIRLWDLENRTCVQEITAHRKKCDESIYDVTFHPSKPYLASAGADALAKVFV